MLWADSTNIDKIPNIPVIGRLKTHFDMWEKIGAPDFILDTIWNRYKLPFYTLPKNAFYRNNKTALAHKDFMSSAITELVRLGSVERCEELPTVINPLSVSVQPNG